MRISKEMEKLYIARIRRLLIISPEVTIMAVAGKLKINKDYAHKLLKKIRGEKVNRYNFYTVNAVLADFEDKMAEAERTLWTIINNTMTTNKDKVAAIRELRNNNKDIIEAMFNAGVFEKQLGRLKTEGKMDDEQHKELLNAFDNAFGTRKSKPNNA